MKQIFIIIFLMIMTQQSMGISFPKTYPYLSLNEAQVNSIIQQAISLGIEKTTKIDTFNAFSYNLDGELAWVSIEFKSTNLNAVLQEQHNLNCQPINQNFSQLICKKYTHNYLKLNSDDTEWIEFKNSYDFSYDELVEVITYANQITPVYWPGHVIFLRVQENYKFQACFSYSYSSNYNSAYRNSYSYRYRCLNITRTTKNEANYFTVDWVATPQFSSG